MEWPIICVQNKTEFLSEIAHCSLVASGMAAIHDITIENEFSEVDAFLNAEAAQAKEFGLEPETAVEASH